MKVISLPDEDNNRGIIFTTHVQTLLRFIHGKDDDPGNPKANHNKLVTGGIGE